MRFFSLDANAELTHSHGVGAKAFFGSAVACQHDSSGIWSNRSRRTCSSWATANVNV